MKTTVYFKDADIHPLETDVDKPLVEAFRDFLDGNNAAEHGIYTADGGSLVLDFKSVALIVAGTPHPDMRTTFLWLRGRESAITIGGVNDKAATTFREHTRGGKPFYYGEYVREYACCCDLSQVVAVKVNPVGRR